MTYHIKHNGLYLAKSGLCTWVPFRKQAWSTDDRQSAFIQVKSVLKYATYISTTLGLKARVISFDPSRIT